MTRILSLLAALEVGEAFKRHVRALMLSLAIGFLLFLALIAGLVGFGAWLTQYMSPWAACGLIVLIILVLTLVLSLINYIIRIRKSERSGLSSAALLMAPTAARVAGSTLLRPGVLAFIGVVVAGALLGRYIGRGSDASE